MDSWKKTAANRRDFKASKDEADNKPSNSAKKDTKKWCKGKQGKKHTLAVKPYKDLKGDSGATDRKHYTNGWYIRYCTTCGKETDYHYPFGKIEKPEWLKAYLIAQAVEPSGS